MVVRVCPPLFARGRQPPGETLKSNAAPPQGPPSAAPGPRGDDFAGKGVVLGRSWARWGAR
jgi:hypothetical protein